MIDTDFDTPLEPTKYESLFPDYVRLSVIKDYKICAYNYYNRIHPFEARATIINNLIKDEMKKNNLDEKDASLKVKNQLRSEYYELKKQGKILDIWDIR